jgi:hypothetical protein
MLGPVLVSVCHCLLEEGLWSLRDRERATQSGAVILEGRVPRVPFPLLLEGRVPRVPLPLLLEGRVPRIPLPFLLEGRVPRVPLPLLWVVTFPHATREWDSRSSSLQGWNLNIGFWNFFGFWFLGFGIFEVDRATTPAARSQRNGAMFYNLDLGSSLVLGSWILCFEWGRTDRVTSGST